MPTLSPASSEAGRRSARSKVGSGYQVVWKNGSADQYIVWNVDSNGNWLRRVLCWPVKVAALETAFKQDVNGDGIAASTVIDSAGSIGLHQYAGTYMLTPSGGTSLKVDGSLVTPGLFGTWTPLAAEQIGSGYQVIWRNGSADQYVVWNVDSNCNWLSQSAVMSGSSTELGALKLLSTRISTALAELLPGPPSRAPVPPAWLKSPAATSCRRAAER